MIYKTFEKNGDYVSGEVISGNRLCVTVLLNGRYISNPVIDEMVADGWVEYIEPEPEPYLPSYAELVEQYIREHGYPTYGSELAIINNYASNPEEYQDTYTLYMEVRKEAKIWAEEQPHRDDNMEVAYYGE